MLRNRNYWLALMGALLCFNYSVQAEVKPVVKAIDPPKRVFFVGNSFSYYNDGIATHYNNLLKAAGLWRPGEYGSRQKTISGGRLAEHLAGFDSLIALPGERHWDVVVLQEFSNGPISQRSDEFRSASTALAAIIRHQQATPVFFMTWAYQGNPQMSAQLRDAYVAQGNQLNMLVVPVGLAFAESQARYPAIELYTKDVEGVDEKGQVIYSPVVKHPNLAGTYLAACVFYAAMLGQSPQGLSYMADLLKEDAARLQEIAWQTSQQFFK